ncbi:MAG: hypothetical protein S4CHLAM20_09060 [Chlamydiia bacterium]|nr:hypothetical protein [Chlamydiia bacterium]
MMELGSKEPFERGVLLSQKIKESYYYFSIREVKKIREPVFLSFKEYVEDLKEITKLAEIDEDLRRELLDYIIAIKMGAKIPIDYFTTQREFRQFVISNHLDRIFFATKLILKYDIYGEIHLPVEIREGSISWFPWQAFRWEKRTTGYAVFIEDRFLFETDLERTFFDDYCVLLYGITKYNKLDSAHFRPYRYEDPMMYDYQNVLEILVNWNVEEKKSYIYNTHVSMELKSSDGLIRSVGQDIFDHIRDLPKYGIFRSAQGNTIIRTPDDASYYPKNHRNLKRFKFPITQQEHDKMIALVESDKYNNKRVASLMRGNCVSYTCRMVNEILGYELKGDILGLELMLRNYFPIWVDVYVIRFAQIYKLLPKWLQKGLFFFPPVYISNLLLGVVFYTTSSFGFDNHRDYSFTDFLLRPWTIRCDIPKILMAKLNKYSDEDGLINRDDYPPGYVFD